MSQAQDLPSQNMPVQPVSSSSSNLDPHVRNLAEYTSAAIFIVEDQAIRYANPAACVLTGFTSQELLGYPFRNLIRPEYREALRSKEAVEGVGDHPVRIELKMITKAGTERWLEVIVANFESDSRPANLITAFDITARKDAEALSQPYLERLGALIRITQEILAAKSMAEMLEKVVFAACKITGARMGVSGHGYTNGSFRVGADYSEPGYGQCPSWEQFNVEKGGVYLELIRSNCSLRLTSQQLQQRPDWWGLPQGHVDLRGFLGASLVGKDGAPVGVIMLTDKAGTAHTGDAEVEFNAEDENLLVQLAAITSLSLQHLATQEELSKSHAELGLRVEKRTQALVNATASLQAEVFERKQVEETLRTTIESLEVAEQGLREQYEELNRVNLQTLENQRIIEAEQRRYQDLFEFAPDGYLVTDNQGIIREANRAAIYMLNLPKEALLGKAILSFVPGQERAKFIENLEQVQGTTSPAIRPHRWEMRLEPPELKPVHTALTVDVQLDNLGRPTGLRWIIRDITARKQAEEELEHTHALLEKVFSSVDVLIAYLDRDFNFQQVNRAYASAVNESLDYFVGKNHFDLYPNPENEAIFRNVVESGEPFIAFEKPFEYAGIPKKGITYWDWSLQPVKSEGGAVTGLVLSLVDITERHRAQELARKNAERAQALAQVSASLVEAGPDYQAVLNIIATATASLLGGASVIRLASEDSSLLLPVAFHHPNPETYEQLRQLLARMPVEANQGLTAQAFLNNKPIIIPDLEADPVRSNLIPEYQKLRDHFGLASMLIVPLSVKNTVLGTIGISRDAGAAQVSQEDLQLLNSLADLAALAISNSRLYQELERALRDEQTMRAQLIQSEKHRAVSRMVASVAHEINNPIQTVRNCLYLTQQDLPLNSSIHEYLNMAILESQRISNLVTQLREVYRPQQIARVEPVDLVVILDEVRQFTNPHLLHEKVEWCQMPSTQPVYVNGIADQLKQVFLNICMNAIEAMQPNGGALNVDLSVMSDSRQARVSFRDNGPGIPLGLLDQIFEPFFTTKDDGTGLGLSICYDVVRSHSGQITVESQPGEGATFTVLLPQADSNSEE